jgi:hypothetical protein
LEKLAIQLGQHCLEKLAIRSDPLDNLVGCPFGFSLLTVTVPRRPMRNKKAGATENPEGFDHAGLLVNEPPGQTGLPFI